MTPRPPMTLDRLDTLLDAWGADPARWPAAERDAALALVAASAEARTRQAAAARLDAALALPDPPGASMRLRRAVLDGIPVPRPGLAARLRGLLQPLGGWRMAGPAFAASLALGVAFGSFVPKQETAVDEDALVQFAQLDNRYQDFLP
ncbi:hypothetical protein [Coralloluteibacterium thermophilus]|uniref:DUF3619 family protein n=1 Tax=Coralloluteibacterium thermophilum TaxID=2707049 RepID=A0ABV9NLH1_9GAMM